VTNLADMTQEQPEAERSAAYATLKNFMISDLHMTDMLNSWYSRDIDRFGYDPREAVCSWVSNNTDVLLRFVPSGYPRVMKDTRTYNEPYLYAAIAFACLVIIVVLVSSYLTHIWSSKPAIRAAQVDFLYLILLGFLFTGASAIMIAIEPSTATCTTQQWLVTLGYTLSYVPLLVKVAAINKIQQQAKRMKRLIIQRSQLFGIVGAALGFVTIYLIVWTIVDTPTRVDNKALVGENIVEVGLGCSSKNSDLWSAFAFAWEAILLVCASVLAFQSRNVRQDFNESRSLATLVYSHFIWAVFRALVTFAIPNSAFKSSVRAAITSLLISCDTLSAIGIYFMPKFIGKRKVSLKNKISLKSKILLNKK